MFLHEDKEAFKDVLSQTNAELHNKIDSGMLEKDYYVTMMLKELAEADIEFIFKGGTSLSKCYHIIDRFSEDIDITTVQYLTQGQKRHMSDIIMAAAEKLGLTLTNRESIQRRRIFNQYIFEYESALAESAVRPQIIVETFLPLLAFPVDVKDIDSYMGQVLRKYNAQVAHDFGLEPFAMPVMDIKRTFIDKVFALCDYYTAGKSERYSRHIYDIHQILTKVELQDVTKQLIEQVRTERTKDTRCTSAVEGANPTEILTKIVESSYFEKDYKTLTQPLLFTEVPYEQAITAIEKIIKSELFTPNR